MKSGVQNFVGDIHDGDVFICTIFALGEIIAMTSTSEKFLSSQHCPWPPNKCSLKSKAQYPLTFIGLPT